MVGIVVEGKNNGKWLYYYEFGGRKMEGFLVDNKRTGNWIIYSLSGTKKSEGKYHNNIRIGVWKYYTSSGKLKAIEDINDDYSMYTEYYTSGEVKSKGKKISGK
jgi:antitoxin component YwqK of YwqJK toxin-antitoxin module